MNNDDEIPNDDISLPSSIRPRTPEHNDCQDDREKIDEIKEPIDDWVPKQLDYLSSRYPFPEFDGFIEFDEPSHKYFIEGEQYPISVSGVIAELEHHFDAVGVSQKIAGRGKYRDKTAEQIVAEWDASNGVQRDLGTSLHLLCERFFNNDITLAQLERIARRGRPEVGQFITFVQDYVIGKLIPLRTELRLFDRDHKVAGSVDIIFRRVGAAENELVMGDFKRSQSIDHENKYNRPNMPKQMMKAPLEHWHDSNLWHYTLQMNLYCVFIEKNTPYRITEMFLIVMHPNQKNGPQIVPIPDCRKEAMQVLECRAAREIFGVEEMLSV
jgi:hypothetical protein